MTHTTPQKKKQKRFVSIAGDETRGPSAILLHRLQGPIVDWALSQAAQ